MAADIDVDRGDLFGDDSRLDDGFLKGGPETDDVYTMLSSERRRTLLRYMVDNDEGDGLALGNLAEAIEFVEGDYDDIDEIGSDDRKRAYISLYQHHIPKLSKIGIIEADTRTNRAFATETTEAVVDVIEDIEDRLVGDDR